MLAERNGGEDNLLEAILLIDERLQQAAQALRNAEVLLRAIQEHLKVRNRLPVRTPEGIERIKKAVAQQFDLPVEALTNGSHRPEFVRARSVAMWLARRLTGESTTAVGQAFARDHSTVLHACLRVQRWRQSDPGFAAQLDQLEAKLKGEPLPRA